MSEAGPPLRRHLAFAAAAWVIDVFVFGFCALTVALLVGLPFALAGAPASWESRARFAALSTRLGVYAMAILLAVLCVVADARWSERRARRVIEAANAYAQTHGGWPASLDALTPSYLTSIPRARHNLLHPAFVYIDGRLTWSSLFFGPRHRCDLRDQQTACWVMRGQHGD